MCFRREKFLKYLKRQTRRCDWIIKRRNFEMNAEVEKYYSEVKTGLKLVCAGQKKIILI